MFLFVFFSFCTPMLSQTQRHPFHVALLGDSNTWIGGDDCSKQTGWNKWFKDIFAPASIRSYARSGATWTNTKNTRRDSVEYSEVLSDDNVIYNQVERMTGSGDTAPDIVIIMAGTNDAWFEKKRPGMKAKTVSAVFRERLDVTVPPSEVTTLAGSVRLSVERIKNAYPACRIFLLTPMQCTATSLEAITEAGDIIEESARLMDVDVIRLDKVGPVKRKTEMKTKHLTKDGTHTNPAGARKNAEIIARLIDKMLKS